MEKNCGVIYDDKEGLGDSTPLAAPDTAQAYADFSRLAAGFGLRVLLARREWYREGSFIRAWDLLSGQVVKNQRLAVCLDRQTAGLPSARAFARLQRFRKQVQKDVPLMNHPGLEEIATDKRRTHATFPGLVPPTFLPAELPQARRQLRGRVVLKPRFGAQGRGVRIVDIATVRRVPASFLVQQFVDTSRGVPGLVSGVHDFRILIINGEPADAYFRIPCSGLVANIALGGILKWIPLRRAPEAALGVARRVDRALASFGPRLYSVDFAIEAGRPRIIELNTHPTIDIYFPPDVPAGVERQIHAKILRALAGMAA